MAEVKDPVLEGNDTFQTEAAPAAPEKKTLSKKQRRKRIRTIIVVVVLLAAAFAAWKLLGGKGGSGSKDVGTEVVQYGSITAQVEGTGTVKAKSSETLTLTTPGTVLDVLVAEGDMVTAGQPLFTIDSPAAKTAVESARSQVEGYEKQLDSLRKDIAGLNLAATYSGKLMDVVEKQPGDPISKGEKVATLVDDTKMRLTQYFSYAYAGEIKAGQTATVSIPALMTTLSGTVESVHMVSRVTPEGSKLFEAEIVVTNPGTLTADMEASASMTVGGQAVYPYESGKLEYNRSSDLCSTVNGTVTSANLLNYLSVSGGQVLVRIDGQDSENEIFSIEQSLEEARKTLEQAEKNLANCNAVAPIDGKVIGLSVTPGMELQANTTLVTISDTNTVIINAQVDERNISFVQPGMSVDLNQWDNTAFGMVDTVSLASTVTNGVATYPIVISADNSEGTLQVNSSINYSLVASQVDSCLVLPLQAVRTVTLDTGDMQTVVYVKADSAPDNAIELPDTGEEIPAGFYPVPVEIGISDDYNVEIKSGVEEGTVVFTQMITSEVWG